MAVWKRAHLNNPEIPNPSEDHGWKVIDGTIEPLWVNGEVIPPKLADILEGTVDDDDNDDLYSDMDSDDDDYDIEEA